MLLYVWPVVDLPLDELDSVVIRSLAPRTEGLGLEQILVQFRLAPTRRRRRGEPKELLLRMSRPPGAGLSVQRHRTRRPGRCASSTPTRRR